MSMEPSSLILVALDAYYMHYLCPYSSFLFTDTSTVTKSINFKSSGRLVAQQVKSRFSLLTQQWMASRSWRFKPRIAMDKKHNARPEKIKYDNPSYSF